MPIAGAERDAHLCRPEAVTKTSRGPVTGASRQAASAVAAKPTRWRLDRRRHQVIPTSVRSTPSRAGDFLRPPAAASTRRGVRLERLADLPAGRMPLHVADGAPRSRSRGAARCPRRAAARGQLRRRHAGGRHSATSSRRPPPAGDRRPRTGDDHRSAMWSAIMAAANTARPRNRSLPCPRSWQFAQSPRVQLAVRPLRTRRLNVVADGSAAPTTSLARNIADASRHRSMLRAQMDGSRMIRSPR